MGLFDYFFKKKIHNRIPNDFELKEEIIKAEWNGPKYIIGFPNKEKPFIPYFHLEGQDEQWFEAPSNGHTYHDPIEDYPEFKEISRIIDQIVDKELGNRKHLLGYCHLAWAFEKRLLEEQYGIKWHSVADLNPLYTFD